MFDTRDYIIFKTPKDTTLRDSASFEPYGVKICQEICSLRLSEQK